MGGPGVCSRLVPMFLVAFAAALLSACGSGVHVQGAPTSGGTRHTSASTPTATPVTTGFGKAQPAVDTVVAMFQAYNAAARSPATSTTAGFDKFLAGQAKQAFDSEFAQAKAEGIAASGTPDAARFRLLSMTDTAGLPEVVLINCPLASATDSAGAYYTKTGKPVEESTPTVPRPWAQTVKVFQPTGAGPWVITSIQTDTSKTCTG